MVGRLANLLSQKEKSTRKGRKRSKRSNNNAASTPGPTVGSVAKLISDPCNAPLVPTYGGPNGYFGRSADVTMLSSMLGTEGAVGTDGFVIWFPQYACQGNSASGQTKPVNICGFANMSASVHPGLNGSLYYGSNSTGSSTAIDAYSNAKLSAYYDPAAQFIQSGIAEDSRCLAACISLKYTGPTSTNQGMFYPLYNIPLDAVFNGGSTGTGSIPHAMAMLKYAGSGKRLEEGIDIKFSPDSVAMQFQDIEYGPLLAATSTNNPPTGDSAIARTAQPMGFGFAFINAPNLQNVMVSYTKAYEWRAKPSSGLNQVGSTVTIADPTFVQRAVSFLDKSIPNWKDSMATSAVSMLSEGLRRVVLGGADQHARTRGVLRIGL